MLVEKKSFKNLIKPAVKLVLLFIGIFLVYQMELKLCFKNYDFFSIKNIGISLVASLISIIGLIQVVDFDFKQIVKINDLSKLNYDELQKYCDLLYCKEKYREEYLRAKDEYEKRQRSKEIQNTIIIHINGKHQVFNDTLKYINESILIPEKIKESLKEDIINSYVKYSNMGEYFKTSVINSAIFRAAENEIYVKDEDYGDYGLLYEYDKWKRIFEELEKTI